MITAADTEPGGLVIIVVYISSGLAVAVTGASVWLSRISVKIRLGKPLNSLESLVAGRIGRRIP